MSLPDRARATLVDWQPPRGEQTRLRDRFVAHLDARPDGVWRTCRPDHLTAGALVLDPDGAHVLLTLHAKARRWFQLGGHLEAGDAGLAEAALREATEESGVPGLRLDPTPLHLDEHVVGFCGVAEAHHLDVRFLAVAPAAADVVVSEESLDVAWWPVDDLPGAQPELVDLVAAGRRRLQSVTDPGSSSASDSWPGGGCRWLAADQPSR